jgi:hypothetical protein
MALSKWGMILSQTGQGDPKHIWSLVQVYFSQTYYMGTLPIVQRHCNFVNSSVIMTVAKVRSTVDIVTLVPLVVKQIRLFFIVAPSKETRQVQPLALSFLPV